MKFTLSRLVRLLFTSNANPTVTRDLADLEKREGGEVYTFPPGESSVSFTTAHLAHRPTDLEKREGGEVYTFPPGMSS